METEDQRWNTGKLNISRVRDGTKSPRKRQCRDAQRPKENLDITKL